MLVDFNEMLILRQNVEKAETRTNLLSLDLESKLHGAYWLRFYSNFESHTFVWSNQLQVCSSVKFDNNHDVIFVFKM